MTQLDSREPQKHLYEEVASRIAGQIDRGVLKPGDRLPSVRRLKTNLRVSLATVLQAYSTLENKGLIEARPQSGYYVRLHQRELPQEPAISAPSAAATRVDIADLALQVHELNLDPRVVPLGAATPSPDLLPTKKLYSILRAVTRRDEVESNRYEPASGNVELRRQIARRSTDYGCQFNPDEILVTSGCSEALNLSLRAVTKPGDTVAVESPTYFGFLQMLETLNLKAVEVATDPGQGICVDALESQIRKSRVAVVVLQGNFQNPLGASIPEDKKRHIVRLLAQTEIPLIEDDIYGDLFFGFERPKAMKSFDRDGNVLLCSSFSKTLSPGFRIGWSVPGRYHAQVRRLKLTNSISTATLPQLTIAEMLSSGGYDRYLRRARQTYQVQMQIMTQAVKKYFPRGTKVTRPGGGTVLWVEFPQGVDSLELYRKALQRNISIVPGPLFSPKRQFGQCIRLNCAHPWSDRMEDAMATIGQLAARSL